MKTGYIKLFRSIEDWEWIDDPVMLYFWVRILLMANWDDVRFRGMVVGRGSFLTSYRNLADTLGLSLRQVRTCIEHLISCKQIEIKTTHLPTHFATQITICNYDTYQGDTNIERHSERQTNDTVATQFADDTLYKEEEEYKKNNKDTNVSRPKSRPDPLDFDFVMDLWNSTMTKVPKVRSLTQARKEKIRLRVKEMGGLEKAREVLSVCFRKIEESDFCNGTSGKWSATFDWFFDNEKNWLKVLEGNYDNRKPVSRIEQFAETSARFNNLLDELYGTGNPRTTDGPADTPDEQ